MKTAIIAITRNGARLGALLQDRLPESRLFVIAKYAEGAATPFSDGVQALVEPLWPACRGFVFIMATGIVVRTIAPLLTTKDRDPAVVSMDDAGRFAVSLLAGHLGGANALAEACAEITGSTPVVTTATDVNDLPSFDMLAKDKGWHIDDLSRVKVLNALLLEGEEIAVVDPSGEVERYFAGKGKLTFHEDFVKALASGAKGLLFVTNRLIAPDESSKRLLVLRPENLVLGIGCNRGTEASEIGEVVREHLEMLSLSAASVRRIATARAKADEPGLLAFAGEFGKPLVAFESEELNEVEFPSPPSEHAFAAIGAKGVAEPAALLASGGGKLILHKIKSGNITLAIAEKTN